MSLLPADPARKSAVLVAFLALAGVYFTHTWHYSPGMERVETARLRLVRIEEANRVARAGAAMGEAELEERLALYQEHIGRLEQLIPVNEEVAALLEAVSDEERRAGVEVTMMRPEPVEAGEFYDQLSYELAVRGSYHAVGTFLAAIASLERIVAPGDLAVTPGGPSGAEDGPYDGTVSATFRIRTYVARPTRPHDDAEQPAGKGVPTS